MDERKRRPPEKGPALENLLKILWSSSEDITYAMANYPDHGPSAGPGTGPSALQILALPVRGRFISHGCTA